MPNCMVCSKKVNAGFIVCGDCAEKMKEHAALKTLYLVLEEDGLWAGGYDSDDLQPLFGGTYAELGASLKTRMDTGKYGFIQVVSSKELNKIREEKGLKRLPSVDEFFAGMETESTSAAWTMTDDDSCQYVRNARKDGEYELIEMDLVDPDKDRYAVYTDTVNAQEYIDSEPEELAQILSAYSYSSVADVIKQYGPAAMQIIAECIFEYCNIHKGETLFTGSRKACERFIREYVEEKG